MRISVVLGKALSPEHVAAWRFLQRSNPRLGSPFLCPDYTLAVARAGEPVEVAVLQDAAGAVGFFPYQRVGPDEAEPVGEPMNDCQAIVGAPELAFDPAEILRACGLRCWHFNHLLASQVPFWPFHQASAQSPFMDLSRGYDAWSAGRPERGGQPLARLRERERRLGRVAGPLRFEPDSSYPGLLERLIDWKRAQYARTRVPDPLAPEQRRQVLREIAATRTAGFAGMLSALWAGDDPIAAHFGMRSDKVLHWWFPVYSSAHAWASPGLLLLLHLARYCAEQGIGMIDMGKGSEGYKLRFQTGGVALAEGAIHASAPPADLASDIATLRTEDQRLVNTAETATAAADLEREVAALTTENRRLASAADAAWAEAQALRTSGSWRLAGPLRAGYDGLSALREVAERWRHKRTP